MKRGLVVLGCAWILWAAIDTPSPGKRGIVTVGRWVPQAAFETLMACGIEKSLYEKYTSVPGVQERMVCLPDTVRP